MGPSYCYWRYARIVCLLNSIRWLLFLTVSFLRYDSRILSSIKSDNNVSYILYSSQSLFGNVVVQNVDKCSECECKATRFSFHQLISNHILRRIRLACLGNNKNNNNNQTPTIIINSNYSSNFKQANICQQNTQSILNTGNFRRILNLLCTHIEFRAALRIILFKMFFELFRSDPIFSIETQRFEFSFSFGFHTSTKTNRYQTFERFVQGVQS